MTLPISHLDPEPGPYTLHTPHLYALPQKRRPLQQQLWPCILYPNEGSYRVGSCRPSVSPSPRQPRCLSTTVVMTPFLSICLSLQLKSAPHVYRDPPSSGPSSAKSWNNEAEVSEVSIRDSNFTQYG